MPTDDSLAVIAEITADAIPDGYDPDLERETPADVAAYWADMDAAVAFRAWEDAPMVDTYDPVPF